MLLTRPVVAADSESDPYLWLEDAHGARSMAWVQAENEKTLAVLEKDPRYAELYAEALAIAEAEDRIPEPTVVGGAVYNFWQGKGTCAATGGRPRLNPTGPRLRVGDRPRP